MTHGPDIIIINVHLADSNQLATATKIATASADQGAPDLGTYCSKRHPMPASRPARGSSARTGRRRGRAAAGAGGHRRGGLDLSALRTAVTGDRRVAGAAALQRLTLASAKCSASS